MKKFLIGCGVAVLIAIVVGVIAVFTFGPRILQWGSDMANKAKEGFVREQQRLEAVANWTAPAPEAPVEALFPGRVRDATRTVVQDGATLAALQITRPARQATYAQTGAEIEVWAFQVNDLERDGLLAQIKSAHDSGSGTKTSLTLPSRSMYSGTGIGTNHIVTPPGWVLVFRPRGDADALPFIDAFLGLAPESGSP